jgi:cell division protein FtsW (lipid II flippase)
VLVLAVHVPHLGVSVNGARRWLGAGPLQFEPAELMKLALVLYSATLLARRPHCVHSLRELVNPLCVVVGGGTLWVVVGGGADCVVVGGGVECVVVGVALAAVAVGWAVWV